MNNDDKILKVLETLQADMSDVKQRQAEQGKQLHEQGKQLHEQGKQLHEQGSAIAHISTAIATLATKQDVETTVDAAKAELASKADVLDLGGKIEKYTKSYKTRLEELEKDAGIVNRDKN